MAAFGAYLHEFPLSRALAMLLELKRRHRYLTTSELADTIHAALRAQAPFALVRLGDGEGAWFSPGATDEARYTPLCAQNRAEVTAIWFGMDFTPETNGFAALATAHIRHCIIPGF
jgi:hypothetical protein